MVFINITKNMYKVIKEFNNFTNKLQFYLYIKEKFML